MISVDTIKYEASGRLRLIEESLGKVHLSVRWESLARIARLGVCIENYTWETRMAVIEKMVEFERHHADDFGIEFDVVPLHAVQNDQFAQA